MTSELSGSIQKPSHIPKSHHLFIHSHANRDVIPPAERLLQPWPNLYCDKQSQGYVCYSYNSHTTIKIHLGSLSPNILYNPIGGRSRGRSSDITSEGCRVMSLVTIFPKLCPLEWFLRESSPRSRRNRDISMDVILESCLVAGTGILDEYVRVSEVASNEHRSEYELLLVFLGLCRVNKYALLSAYSWIRTTMRELTSTRTLNTKGILFGDGDKRRQNR